METIKTAKRIAYYVDLAPGWQETGEIPSLYSIVTMDDPVKPGFLRVAVYVDLPHHVPASVHVRADVVDVTSRPPYDPREEIVEMSKTEPIAVAQEPCLADIRSVYPDLWLNREEQGDAQVLLRLYGGSIFCKCLDELKKERLVSPKKRIFLSNVREWLQSRVKLSVEDYRRAGLNPPDGAKWQKDL